MEAVELTWSERILQQGIAQGREQGIEQGLEQGAVLALRGILEELVRTRFGSVPALLAARIADADRQTLDRLIIRASLATSLDELSDE